jgi:NADPH-dependent 7-cyano-7-deazaguanine reductase QueF
MDEKKPKVWSNRNLLQKIKNPCEEHVHIATSPELSFYGFPNQPDYATYEITMIPNDSIIELKSMKIYFAQFQLSHISYERLLNTAFEDFWEIYKPKYLKVMIETRPRGGISSKLYKERNQ